ncbi:hypothetical protein BC827DRAFT_1158382 [Russula dissimulans]|nr:hypothetical protein BC827DRAFT_1158382 [Russula dissimulans]
MDGMAWHDSVCAIPSRLLENQNTSTRGGAGVGLGSGTKRRRNDENDVSARAKAHLLQRLENQRLPARGRATAERASAKHKQTRTILRHEDGNQTDAFSPRREEGSERDMKKKKESSGSQMQAMPRIVRNLRDKVVPMRKTGTTPVWFLSLELPCSYSGAAHQINIDEIEAQPICKNRSGAVPSKKRGAFRKVNALHLHHEIRSRVEWQEHRLQVARECRCPSIQDNLLATSTGKQPKESKKARETVGGVYRTLFDTLGCSTRMQIPPRSSGQDEEAKGGQCGIIDTHRKQGDDFRKLTEVEVQTRAFGKDSSFG